MAKDTLNKEISSKVVAAISKTKGIARNKIGLKSTFEELKMDSLDGLNLFFELEDVFDLTIPDEKARSLRTVGDIVKEIKGMLADQRAAE